MQIKSVIIDNIHYINFIIFNISTLLLLKLFGFALLKLGCVLYPVKYGNLSLLFLMYSLSPCINAVTVLNAGEFFPLPFFFLTYCLFIVSWIILFFASLSNSKFPQVPRTLLSILADLNNAVVWMVLICPRISNLSSSLSKPFWIVPNAPITIGITITFIYHSFLSSLARSDYLPLFTLSLIFTLLSTLTAKFFIW